MPNRERLKACMNDCHEAIGEVLVKHFPEAVSGDCDPWVELWFSESLDELIRCWVENNVPEEVKP